MIDQVRRRRLAVRAGDADDTKMQRRMVVVLRGNRSQCGTTVGHLNLRQRRRRRRFNQERHRASLLCVRDELVTVEIGASQRREQISWLDQAGVIDDP